MCTAHVLSTTKIINSNAFQDLESFKHKCLPHEARVVFYLFTISISVQ